jgi:hypothetical protein
MNAGIFMAVHQEGVEAELEARNFVEEAGSTALRATKQDRIILLDEFDQEGENFGVVGSGNPDLVVGHVFLVAREVLPQTLPVDPLVIFAQVEILQLAREVEFLPKQFVYVLFQRLCLDRSETARSECPEGAIDKTVEDVVLFFEFAHAFNLLAVEVVKENLKETVESSSKHHFALTVGSFFHLHHEVHQLFKRIFELVNEQLAISADIKTLNPLLVHVFGLSVVRVESYDACLGDRLRRAVS